MSAAMDNAARQLRKTKVRFFRKTDKYFFMIQYERTTILSKTISLTGIVFQKEGYCTYPLYWIVVYFMTDKNEVINIHRFS